LVALLLALLLFALLLDVVFAVLLVEVLVVPLIEPPLMGFVVFVSCSELSGKTFLTSTISNRYSSTLSTFVSSNPSVPLVLKGQQPSGQLANGCFFLSFLMGFLACCSI
jgi:hypothetical protein